MAFDVLVQVLCFQWGSVIDHSELGTLRPTGGESITPIPPNPLIPGQIEALTGTLRHATVGHGLPSVTSPTCCSKGTRGTRGFPSPPFHRILYSKKEKLNETNERTN